MSQFSYSLCLSLFHSLWQSALLLLFYFAIQPLTRKQLPSFKRNILYTILLFQLVIFVITFFIYYAGSVTLYRNIIETGFSGLLGKQPFIEKISPWIISIYTSIIFFKSLSLIYNWYRFKKLCTSTMTRPTIDLKLFTIKKANEFGIKRKVTLWFSNAVSTPLTFGFLKPVILMPVALLNHLSIKDAESLIIHELTHIKNNDYLLNWLLVVAETLFFYNPFVRIIAGRIKLEREKNCDVQVLHFQYPAISYAETLLKTAKFKTNINFFPLAAVFKNKQLLQRIHFFTLDHNLVFSKKKYNVVSLSVLVTALLINLLVIVQLKNYKANKAPELSAFNLPAAIIPDSFGIAAVEKEEATTEPESESAASNESLDEKVRDINLELEKLNIAAQVANKTAFELSKKQFDINYAVPVVNVHPVAAVHVEPQEVVVEEESSGTPVVISKAYKMTWKDGKWKKELAYVIKENLQVKDSICVLKDSVVSYIPPMQ